MLFTFYFCTCLREKSQTFKCEITCLQAGSFKYPAWGM